MDESTRRTSEDESRKRAENVLDKHADRLLDHRDVTAIDVGYKTKNGIKQSDGGFCLVIWVRKKLPESLVAPEQLLPKEIDGVDTDIIEGEVYYI